MMETVDRLHVKPPDEAQFPAQGSFADRCRFLLEYAIRAPSTRNTQPWKFALHQNGIDMYADYSRRLRTADPGNRELLMSMGAAIMNLRVAAARFRFSCQVEYNHSGDSERPLAQVFLAAGTPGDAALASLFPFLPLRRTNRHPFLVSRVPAAVQQRLIAAGEGYASLLEISTDGVINGAVADLVAEADRRLLADPEYRRDIAAWMWPDPGPYVDGIPAGSEGSSESVPALGFFRAQAARDKNLCLEAPALITIAGEDTIPGWLDTGEMLERLLLTIVREGLQVGYFNMPVLLPDLRLKLRVILGLSSWPQLLLRVGYCMKETPLSLRRPLDTVIIQ
jgi:nitroreductase